MTTVWKAKRTYEGRTSEVDYTDTLEDAKVAARNLVNLDEPAEWRDETEDYQREMYDNDKYDAPPVNRLVLANFDDNNDVEVTITRIQT